MKTEKDQTVAVCTLHVDDGMLAGDPRSKHFKEIYNAINERFNIKEWKTLGEVPVDFLGCQVLRQGNMIVDCMKTYVMKIEPMEVPRSGDDPLSDAQRTAFRRLIMQLRWPAQQVLPENLSMV